MKKQLITLFILICLSFSGIKIRAFYSNNKLESNENLAIDAINDEKNASQKVSITYEDIKVEVYEGRYKITVQFDGFDDIERVLFPTWTEKNGQDDIIWGEGIITNDTVTYTVDMRDHNYETGKYITHIYTYDRCGNKVGKILPTQVIENKPPKISDIKIENLPGKYKITAKINDDYGIEKVLFPTWTQKNGQDDIIWGEGLISNDTVTYMVDMKDHNYETGNYVTHVYVYDKGGNKIGKILSTQVIENKPPKIYDIKIENLPGKYKITAKISDDYGIEKVLFPTWTQKNGQDDIIWGEGKISNGTVTYIVDMKDHNYEIKDYITHIYVYDLGGNKIGKILPVQQIVNNPPKISNVKISDITSQGYLITCTVTDDYEVDKVLFPTWSVQNGQDDITWGKGTISGNTVTYRVYTKDHNYEFGDYITHVYAYDKAGLSSGVPLSSVSINSYNNPGWKIENGHKYLYDANGKIVGSGTLVIDISEHNGSINWTAVKNAGVDAVILRSSYGYESDLTQMDKRFKENVRELNRLGIPYGIYHFSYARYTSEGADEARYVLKCLKEAGAKPSLPIYYDLEYSSYVGNKDGSFYSALTKNFAKVIDEAGYQTGVYANYNWWSTKLTDQSFNAYIKWVAHYGSSSNNSAATANPYWHPGNEYKLWQYTSCGTIKGINSRVDMNIMF